MSLPNGGDDDDHWGHQPPPFGKGDPSDFHKDHSKITMSPSSEDTATAAETSAGSNSVVSGFSSIALGDGTISGVATPQIPHPNINNTVMALPPYTSSQIHNNYHINNNINNTSMGVILNQRDRYIRQLRTLAMASGASFALAILVLVPPPVLLSMIVCLAVVFSFLYKLYQLLLWEYQRLVRGRGIGDYLPSSIYEQLTRTSVHEFMSNTRDSYVNENAYLMLYMIPGLTYDQINEYVGRLSPRHQELLHRQGLGNVLGNGFMRLIMGDERLQPEQQRIDATEEENDDDDTAAISGFTESPSSSLASGGSTSGGGGGGGAAGHHNMVPRRLELPPTIPEGSSEDDESATSELGHEEDPATQFLRHWGVEPETSDVPPENARRRVVATRASVAASHQTAAALTSDAPPSRRSSQHHQVSSDAAARAEAEAEEQVLYDAIGSAVTTYIGVAATMVQTSARRSATLFSGTVFRASMGMTLFGVGVGIYGFWTGAYTPQSFFRPVVQMVQSQVESILRPPRRLELPSSQVLVGTTLLSGATAGIMLLFQIASVRKEDRQHQKNQGCEDHDSEEKNHRGTCK